MPEQHPGAGRHPSVRTIISKAYEGDFPPGPLSVAIVSLIELSQHAMPDLAKIRENLKTAQFAEGKEDRAEAAGRMLALDRQVVAEPLTNMRHSIFARERNGEGVILLLTEADAGTRKMVFCSAIFRGGIEADTVKAVVQVTQKQPFTGASVTNADGYVCRRAFWDLEGEAGIRGLMTTGPANVEDEQSPRAITVFNYAQPKVR